MTWSVLRIPFGGFFFGFFGIFGDGAFVRQVNFDTDWGTEVLKGWREVGTKPKWFERSLSTKE